VTATVQVVRFTVRGEEYEFAPAFGHPDSAYTVVYDGDCNVCQRLARRLTAWDRRSCFEIVPSQQPGVRARFPWIPARAYLESLQLVRSADGRTWQGAAAIEEILRVVPRGRWFAWIFRIPLVRPVAEWLYRAFARNRYRLGCGEHCQLRHADLEFDQTPGSAD
jgi:predicted DCC family thiol-disulfide oxidoreductase YuxK